MKIFCLLGKAVNLLVCNGVLLPLFCEMSIIKTITRKIVLPVLAGLRFDKLLLLGTKKNCLIANFHGVSDVIGNRFNNRHLDVHEFEKIIIYLKNNFKIVSLPEIFEINRSGKQPEKKTIALTFDDGYINNFTVALPVLKKYNVPATFYLISKGLVDDSYYVWPDIIDLIQRNVKENIILGENTFVYPGFYSEKLKLSLVDYLKSCGSKQEIYIRALTDKYSFHIEMAKKHPQLIELIRKNEFPKYAGEPLIEYGSHTHSHFNLEYLSESECEKELNESKNIIKQFTGKDPISLAFPDGSYNKETLKVSAKTGYKNLVAVAYKFNENNSDPDLLSRFTISNSTTWQSNALRLGVEYKKFAF
jgi:peptidoglycan/xylan/chitin deacetylase (PgdA/CDA1 family)